jgi:hypothetical protein
MNDMSKYRLILWQTAKRLIWVCTALTVGAWWVLMARICSSPRSPNWEYTIPYECHGATVFISSLQNTLRLWLLPVFFVLFFVLYLIRKRD